MSVLAAPPIARNGFEIPCVLYSTATEVEATSNMEDRFYDIFYFVTPSLVGISFFRAVFYFFARPCSKRRFSIFFYHPFSVVFLGVYVFRVVQNDVFPKKRRLSSFFRLS